MKRIINQNYSHLLDVEPIEKVGRWYVYNLEDVPFGWPGNGVKLSLEVNSSQIEWLRINDQVEEVDERDIVIENNDVLEMNDLLQIDDSGILSNDDDNETPSESSDYEEMYETG